MKLTTFIRHTDWSAFTQLQQLASAIGEFARDISVIVGNLLAMNLYEFTQLYTEPMQFALQNAPAAIICVRVRNQADQQTPVSAAMCMVHWYWDSRLGSAVINKIGGMTVGTGARYIFTFLVLG